MNTQQLVLKTASGIRLSLVVRFAKMALTLIVLIFCLGCKKAAVVDSAKASSAKSEASTSAVADFTVVVMPDTQHYFAGFFGGTVAMFNSQINWIKNNKAAHNIVYVAGVGDIVEHGDNPSFAGEWTNAADNGYYNLESSSIPYGLAVGNHDQGADPYTDWGRPLLSPTNKYNAKFGISHFNNTAHSYWRGNYGTNNDSHYDFFSAGGIDFMVIYIEFDSYNDDRQNMANWAKNLCLANPNRKVIVVTHYMIGAGTLGIDGGAFGAQGQGLYDTLKVCPNVFVFLGGHVSGTNMNQGEGYREDTYQGRTIRTYLSDYQNSAGGGNGYLRLMKFSVDGDDVSVKTYSPYLGTYQTDANSQFTKPLFGAAPTAPLANGKYKIIAKHSGQAVVVKDALTTNNARVVQYAYSDNGVHNDQWTLTQVGTTGYYKVINVHSGKGMAIYNASTEYGAGDIGYAIQYTYTADTGWNDEWALIPVGGGYYKIIARHSGLSLNVAGGDSVPLRQVKQWKYEATDNVDNDKFQLIAIP